VKSQNLADFGYHLTWFCVGKCGLESPSCTFSQNEGCAAAEVVGDLLELSATFSLFASF
jgi:hypothetical protein